MTKQLSQASVVITACIKICYFISAVTAIKNFQKSFMFDPPNQLEPLQIFNCLCLISEKSEESSVNRGERILG